MSDRLNTVSLNEIEAENGYMSFVRTENETFFNTNGYRKGAFVLTLGCQQNESDSEKLAGMAEKMGYEIVSDPNDAYLIIVNTCAIREHAEKRALSLVGQYKHIKAKRSELIIAVCGCMVVQQHRAEAIKHSYPYVDIVFGTSSIYRLPEYLCEKMKRGRDRKSTRLNSSHA